VFLRETKKKKLSDARSSPGQWGGWAISGELFCISWALRVFTPLDLGWSFFWEELWLRVSFFDVFLPIVYCFFFLTLPEEEDRFHWLGRSFGFFFSSRTPTLSGHYSKDARGAKGAKEAPARGGYTLYEGINRLCWSAGRGD
jgi:hypothetical protein